jgi:hypothetical protein
MAGNTKHAQGQPIHFGNLQVPTTMKDASSVFGEIPEQYGVHNLSRQTVFRADGTEHSYYTLPENYPLELASPEPVFSVYDDESDGFSIGSIHVFTGTLKQLTDEEEQHEKLQALKCFRKPKFGTEKLTVDTVSVFSLTNEQSICDLEKLNDGENYSGRHVWCIQQVLQYVFTSGCAMGDVQLLKDYKLNMLLTEEGREVWDPGASPPFISSKIQYPGKFVQLATHATKLACSSVKCFSGCKYLPFCSQKNICVYWPSEKGMTAYCYWDPGILNIIHDRMLDKYAVSHQVQFVQRTTEVSFLSFTNCMQYIASDGINPVRHGTVLIMQRGAQLSQGKYLCSLYFPSVLKTEYCQLRCLWEFSIKLVTKLQWDPGICTPSSMYL